MDIRYFELRAANKDCQEKFSEIAKQNIREYLSLNMRAIM